MSQVRRGRGRRCIFRFRSWLLVHPDQLKKSSPDLRVLLRVLLFPTLAAAKGLFRFVRIAHPVPDSLTMLGEWRHNWVHKPAGPQLDAAIFCLTEKKKTFLGSERTWDICTPSCSLHSIHPTIHWAREQFYPVRLTSNNLGCFG